MTEVEVLKIQEEIIRDLFDDDSIEVTLSTNADDVDDWDSLSHIQLISKIETHFKVRFALGELQSLKNVGDMTNLILKKLGS